MKTTSINIYTHAIPCYNRCRYCLLSWNGKTIGAEYDRCEKYAERFYNWLQIHHPDINFAFYFGYSMEHPQLINKIPFLQKIKSPSGTFLQFDGMKMRTNEELDVFIRELKNSGIKTLNFTFYGKKEFHDKFANRIGDFDLMDRTIDIAKKSEIEVEVGIPVIKDILKDLDDLVDYFEKRADRLFLFTPHSKGRGIILLNHKITANDYENFSVKAKHYFNRENNKTPWEWLNTSIKDYEYRILNISLLPDNIDHFLNQSFDQTILEIEKMDDEYYSMIPTFSELLKKYANKDDTCLYSKKDLYYLLSQKYIKENDIQINDVNDERFCGSIRY